MVHCESALGDSGEWKLHSLIALLLVQAGTYIFWCQEHKVCIGFFLMHDKESPRTPFEALFTRWLEAPEGMSLTWHTHAACIPSWHKSSTWRCVYAEFQYDNGCNLLAYLLAREPDHFKTMRVVVDATHYPVHRHCSHAFNVCEYPKRYANSQLQEQKNSRIEHFKSQAVFFNQLNFLYFFRYMLYRLNRRQRAVTAAKVSLV
jgi:hypothetical protein